jgi:hypothetical protein
MELNKLRHFMEGHANVQKYSDLNDFIIIFIHF